MGISHIGEPTGSFLMTVSYYRLPTGEVRAVLEDMPVHVIDGETTISRRFSQAASWTVEGALSLMRQCVQFDDETRAANESNAQPSSGSSA